MCGIAGFLGIPPELAAPAAQRMRHALHHRGPDDQDTRIITGPAGHTPATLVHTRLAILDLSPAGHQPMQDHPPEGGPPANWIVFNGEIFNFHELQREVADAGWPCRTRSDTEVILHAYRAWGTAAVDRFHGMFAWCLLDAERGTAWFCRDRLGMLPLYFYRRPEGGLIFASEVKALLACGPELVPPKVRRSALEAYLAQGAVYGDQSIIDGIELLPPGHSLVTDWSGKTQKQTRYWFVPTPGPSPVRTRADAVAAVGEELRRSVKQRLISDVPLGLFLSGGIDSGALATVITEDPNIRLRTLSIGFDAKEFDETDIAQGVATELKTDHTVRTLYGSEVLRDLPAAMAAFDQPTIDGFNTYFVAREAHAAGLTVALSGTGGDELFGGYPTFRYVPWTGRLQAAGVTGPLRSLFRSGLRRSGRRGAMRLAELFDRPRHAIQRYLLRWELFLPGERRSLHPLPVESDRYSGIPNLLLDEMREVHDPDVMSQISRFEIRGFLGQILLRDGDISSMASSLELRTPILEHRMVELAIRLPGKWKRPDPRNKPLLIDAVGKRFPQQILGRPKRGFSLPWKPWLLGPLAGMADAAVRDADIWTRLGFDPTAPVKFWERFRAGDRTIAATQVLALIVLAAYANKNGLRM